MNNRSLHEFAAIKGRTWDAAAVTLANQWAQAIRIAPREFEQGDAYLWYAQMEGGGFTLCSTIPTDWNPIGRQFLISIDLLEQNYRRVAELADSEFDNAYELLVKRAISCLRKARKLLLSKSWPSSFQWVKTKTCFFVDNAEVVSYDVVKWFGGKRLQQEPASTPGEAIVRFCRKFDLVREWMFLGSEKKLKVIAIYQAANRKRVLESLIDLLKDLPESVLPRRLAIDHDVKVALPTLRRIEEALGCKAIELKEEFLDFVDRFGQRSWNSE